MLLALIVLAAGSVLVGFLGVPAALGGGNIFEHWLAPVTEAHARAGVRWVRLNTDVPNALLDIRAGRLRLGEYLRSFRGVRTEAVFSVSDPLPGLYEIALLPYLAVKRGL